LLLDELHERLGIPRDEGMGLGWVRGLPPLPQKKSRKDGHGSLFDPTPGAKNKNALPDPDPTQRAPRCPGARLPGGAPGLFAP